MKYFDIDKQTDGKYTQFKLFCDKGRGYWERTRSLTPEEVRDIENRILDIFEEYGMGFGEKSLDAEFHYKPQ